MTESMKAAHILACEGRLQENETHYVAYNAGVRDCIAAIKSLEDKPVSENTMPIDDTIMTFHEDAVVSDSFIFSATDKDSTMIFTIRRDGSIEKGPGYTTDSDAALKFYEALQFVGMKINMAPTLGICESHLLEYATSRYQVGYNQAVKDIHKALEAYKP